MHSSATDRIVEQRAQRVDQQRQLGTAPGGCRGREELLKQLALLGARLRLVQVANRIKTA